MKTKVALLLSTASLIQSGTVSAAETSDWITPTIDIRARFEYRDFDRRITGIDILDPSTGLTVRERLGVKTKEWNGLSALIEGEFTQAVIDDYRDGTRPIPGGQRGNTISLDPETQELNQGYLKYSGYNTVAKAGRQQIVYDNAAFIGDVIWRQNQQTYDGFTLNNKSFGGWNLKYAYVTQVNRIFGSEATRPLANVFSNVTDLTASLNLFNATYTGISNLTLGGYAYLMNFDDRPRWDNDTFGLSAKTVLGDVALHGEVAYQNRAGVNVNNPSDAWYSHFIATKTVGLQAFTIAAECLGAGFKTPLATAHAFNGFSDTFSPGRIEGAHNGLSDVYAAYTMPLAWNVKWIHTVHLLSDNDLGTSYGWEYDSVLTKKFNDNFLALAKLAIFTTSNKDRYSTPIPGNPNGNTIPNVNQLTLELNYLF
jgi:Alginate export